MATILPFTRPCAVLENIPAENIVGKECRHAVYRKSGLDDIVLVKEVVHLKDGTKVPNVKLFENYPREFWITKKGFQNHTDKKTYEKVSRCDRFVTNQARLTARIAQAMNRDNLPLKQLAESPFLYGADVTTPVIIKRRYMEKYDIQSISSVAVLDIETNMLDPAKAKKIEMITLTFKEKRHTVILKDFIKNRFSEKEATEKLQECMDTYLTDYLKDRGGNTCTFEYYDTPGQLVHRIFQIAHAWMPDFLAIYNMDFDMKYMVEALEKENYDLGEVFSDPLVPKKYRTAEYKPGDPIKKTHDGKETPKDFTERWHTMDCLSSFYVVDAMVLYKLLRTAAGRIAKYSLDFVLDKELGIRKLKFDDILEKEAPGMSGGTPEWHRFMQRHHPIEYIIYNIFDCVSVEMLDESTGDVCRKLPTLCEASEYKRFPSQPRRIVDDLHFVFLKKGAVIATTSKNMRDDLDNLVLTLEGWIVTLPAELVFRQGYGRIQEAADLSNTIFRFVADLDFAATYPSLTIVLNISKETTFREISRIKGLGLEEYRRLSLNVTGGAINAYEISRQVYGAPTLTDMLSKFKEKHNIAA